MAIGIDTLEDNHIYDLLIVGGGINGTAVARDAAGRGLSVLLCEKDDLASHTSSASTKLIHGGLRYLEHFDFRLVRESLKEREVLLRSAPHIIWPMRFVLPYDEGLRPKWMLRAGLFMYDNMGGRKLLPATRTRNLAKNSLYDHLQDRLKTGYEYSDCWVEDARLVVLNALDSHERGGKILTETQVMSISGQEGLYHASLKSAGKTKTIKARGIVNAAGPWVEALLNSVQGSTLKNESSLRLVKGSHIVVPKLYEGDHSYIFQNADDRIVFAIPYEGDYTLIGTTDVPHDNVEDKPEASDDEIRYLCYAINEYFKVPTKPSDVVWTYSGVRPLYDDQAEDASEVTRDYVLNINEVEKGAPILSVYGGKITTSRKLADHVMDKLEEFFPDMGKAWTRNASLPGGDIAKANFQKFFAAQTKKHPSIDPDQIYLMARRYGTRLEEVLAKGLGQEFGGGLTEADAHYLKKCEWATAADDVLWRRTKCGLKMSDVEISDFRKWFETL